MASSDPQPAHPAPRNQGIDRPSFGRASGVCVWLTGLSGSGKSTTAAALAALLEESGRKVSVLDGDAVRAALSPDLGYTRPEREAHIRRIGSMAAEIVRSGGIVVCAVVSPYRSSRDEVRRMVGHGRFVEVLIDAPVEVCERRDPKGLYGRFRSGEVANVTGLDEPYERPERPELVLDSVTVDPAANARRIVDYLRDAELLPASDRAAEASGRHVPSAPRLVPATAPRPAR